MTKANTRPRLNLRDRRLAKLWRATWWRLPHEVKTLLSDIVCAVSEIKQWDQATKDSLESVGSKRGYGRWRTLTREVQLCKEDCDSVTDDVVIGTLAHELAHAYQTAISPNDNHAIEEAAEQLPRQWGFEREFEAWRAQLAKDEEY